MYVWLVSDCWTSIPSSHLTCWRDQEVIGIGMDHNSQLLAALIPSRENAWKMAVWDAATNLIGPWLPPGRHLSPFSQPFLNRRVDSRRRRRRNTSGPANIHSLALRTLRCLASAWREFLNRLARLRLQTVHTRCTVIKRHMIPACSGGLDSRSVLFSPFSTLVRSTTLVRSFSATSVCQTP